MKVENTKTKKILIAIILVCVITLSFFAGFFTYYLTMSKAQRQVSWFVGLIDKKYTVYDEETGQMRDLTAEDYCDKLAELLDPYSRYYTKEEYSDEMVTSFGNVYGTGVAFSSQSETLKIIVVTGNSPAEKAGVKVGMEIKALRYNGVEEEVKDFTEFSMELSKIPANTDFEFKLSYNGTEEYKTLQKQAFSISVVKYIDSEKTFRFTENSDGVMVGVEEIGGNPTLPSDVGYIKFDGFENYAVEQFSEAYNYLISRGKSKLILDVRYNGGGYMNVLQDIASYLIYNQGKSKNVVAIARDKQGREELFKTNKNNYKPLEIVVLANGGSASATECLIGAMISYGTLDYEHLVITKKGEEENATTYGKGIMQTTYVHSQSQTAAKLTTAYIYWPDKTTCIHAKGIVALKENSVAINENILIDNELNRAIEILNA